MEKLEQMKRERYEIIEQGVVKILHRYYYNKYDTTVSEKLSIVIDFDIIKNECDRLVSKTGILSPMLNNTAIIRSIIPVYFKEMNMEKELKNL